MEGTKQAMSGIVGNDILKNRLCSDVLSNKLSHAYIIEGADGSGRTSLALLTAAAVACERKNDQNEPLPCTECPSCKKLLALRSPDVIFIGDSGKSSVGIEEARLLKHDIYTVPNDLDHKFYIIKNADTLTVQAQNAILLTLEEPPEFVHFFLICNNSDSLLETIRSRAVTFKTEPLSDKTVSEFICENDRRAMQMKLTSEKDFNELIRASGGSIGRALQLLDPKEWTVISQQRNLIKSILLSAAKQSGAKEMLPIISEFSSKRDIFDEQLSLLLIAIRDLLAVKKSDTVSLCFYSDRDEATELCDRFSAGFLFELQNSVMNAISENKRNGNIKLITMKLAICAKLV